MADKSQRDESRDVWVPTEEIEYIVEGGTAETSLAPASLAEETDTRYIPYSDYLALESSFEQRTAHLRKWLSDAGCEPDQIDRIETDTQIEVDCLLPREIGRDLDAIDVVANLRSAMRSIACNTGEPKTEDFCISFLNGEINHAGKAIK